MAIDNDTPEGDDDIESADQLYQHAIDQAKYDSGILVDVIRILKARPDGLDQVDRVQLALDDLAEAACKRALRIMNNDLPPDLR